MPYSACSPSSDSRLQGENSLDFVVVLWGVALSRAICCLYLCCRVYFKVYIIVLVYIYGVCGFSAHRRRMPRGARHPLTPKTKNIHIFYVQFPFPYMLLVLFPTCYMDHITTRNTTHNKHNKEAGSPIDKPDNKKAEKASLEACRLPTSSCASHPHLGLRLRGPLSDCLLVLVFFWLLLSTISSKITNYKSQNRASCSADGIAGDTRALELLGKLTGDDSGDSCCCDDGASRSSWTSGRRRLDSPTALIFFLMTDCTYILSRCH